MNWSQIWSALKAKVYGGLFVLGAVVLIGGGIVFRDDMAAFLSPDAVRYGGGKVYLVRADRRAIFVFNEQSNAGFACPEPSPDVRADVEHAVKTLVNFQRGVPKDQGSDSGSASVEGQQKILMAALMERTQGLQVLRDMLFQACLANVRGDMSGLQYVNFVSQTLPKLTMSLIATELVTKQDWEKGGLRLTGSDLQLYLNFLVLNAN